MLIFKSSGIFNFAQGSMVLFAALTMVGFIEMGLHWTLAFIVTAGVMVLLAIVVEKVVLRPLVNQPHIILFMATIGIFRSEEHTSELQSLMRISYAGFCWNKTNITN